MRDHPLDTPEAWQAEILDFMAWRGPAMFGNWTPRTSKELVRELGGPDWESLLVQNLASAPAFKRDLGRAHQITARQLVHERPAQERQTRGRLRGRVLARRTVRARVRAADPTIWVTESKSKSWQTEANAAVAGFLNHLKRSLRSLEGRDPAPVLEIIDRLLGTNPLRHVEPDAAWASYAMPPWLTAKNEFYRLVWAWADELRRSRRTRDADGLRDLMDAGWLAAESRDKLFELFAFSRLTEVVHASASWSRFELMLPSSGRGIGVKARSADGWTATIRVDRKPRVLGKYGEILSKYAGVDGRGRRPDLQLEVRVKGGRRASTLIEVKATEPNSTYGRDSVVKVFGYIKDYWRLWRKGPTGFPRAVLLYVGEVDPIVSLSDRIRDDEVLLTSASTFFDDMTAVLKAQIGALGIAGSRV